MLYGEQVDTYFVDLTGFPPRQFQQTTIAHLLNRQDVLLRAPTGSGKTETAIAPFLFAKALNLDFPNKLIYVVPLRTLANSLRQRTEALIQRWTEAHPLQRSIVVTLQTGENPEDPRFEGDIVFCTIDQLLSSFLSIPYSVGRGSANVNAGAVFASYLVFDELHLLDPDRSFATVLKLLEQVRGIAPCLLMTATLTDELSQQIMGSTEETGIQNVQIPDSDLHSIEEHRSRSFQAMDRSLSAECILEDIQQHQRRRVIVICNTVSQAQGLFQDLEALNLEGKLAITLLHSRFLPQDRAIKEAELKQTFAEGWNKQANDRCHVLIATQAIEAGINITCEVMHSQLCPMNSLLQRAGRCARFPGEQGSVFVYRTVDIHPAHTELAQRDIDPEPATRQQFLPYPNDTCELTWQVLHRTYPSTAVGFQRSAAWINQVHQEEDLLQAQRRQNNRMRFEENFNKAVFYGDRSTASELIRSNDSRSIFIWEEPTWIDLDTPEIEPAQLQAFSLPVSTLCKIWRDLQNLEYEIDWVFRRIEPPSGKASETYCQPGWKEIRSQSDLIASLQILVNPRYVFYDDRMGLRISIDENEPGNHFVSPPKASQSRTQQYSYHMDTYIGHLGCLWTAWRKPFSTSAPKNGSAIALTYTSVQAELLQAGATLIRSKLLPHLTIEETEVLFEYLVFFAVLLHDLGKLQIQWQSAMRGWQAIAHQQFKGKDPKSHLLAHTDSDPANPAQQQALKSYEKQHRRPPHAVESAFIGREILKRSLLPWLEEHFAADEEQCDCIAHAVILAVGRHHSAWAEGDNLPKQIELHPQAQATINRSWDLLMRFLPQTFPLPKANLSKQSYSTQRLSLGDAFTPDRVEFFQLYLLLARSLRLCDQRSVQQSKKSKSSLEIASSRHDVR